ncbi:hypothetical protein [Streptomyces sp. NPDC001816]|uniref:hypothetical protein n=1 Tax=Streptomyces sp. NPDC001816 TaxID=3364612 RepID=UPI0036B70B56
MRDTSGIEVVPITALPNSEALSFRVIIRSVVLGVASKVNPFDGRVLMGLKIVFRDAFGSMLRRALVVPVATVLATTALGTAAHSAPRLFDADGYIDFQMMDAETFGPNHRCDKQIKVFNNPGSTPGHFWYFATCGGEVRAEFHYTISRNPDGSIVMTDAKALLFEGTSADTRDLDGDASYFWSVLGQPGWIIPRPGSDTKHFHVENWMESEPDDKADITFVIANWG